MRHVKLYGPPALRLLPAALLSSLVAAPASAFAVEAQREITTNTRWEGTVEVRGTVTVRDGAMLLIMPGTTVRFAAAASPDAPDKSALRVEGSLVAQGTPTRPILFTSAAGKPAAGDWWGIDFERANERPNRLRHCLIEYATQAIHGTYSPLLLEDVKVRASVLGLYADRELSGGAFQCDFDRNEAGILYHQNAGFALEKSRVRDSAGAGIACVLGSSPRILANEITGNKVGISCIQGSSPIVGANVIAGNARGVHVEFKSQPAIIRNEIVDNGLGVEVVKLAFPKITANLIARNDVGIYCNYSGYPEVRENNIHDNRKFGLVLGDNMSIVMEKIIPFRDKGRNYDAIPVDPELLPAQSRKATPLPPPDEGIVDARGNWWGAQGTAEAAAAGGEGNVSFIEDFRDKPDTYYQDKVYPRDKVAFAPWEPAAVVEAGLPGAKYAGVRGKVLRRGKPVAGARVHVFPWGAGGRSGEGGNYSAPTGEDGSFSLHLAPGDCLLEARKTAAVFPHLDPQPGDLVGTSGPEPVPVREGSFAEVTIELAEVVPPGVTEPAPPPR